MSDTLGPYPLNTIVTGDARELAKAIPDESVDLIFCDPVYSRVDDYRWLAEIGSRLLKPGGNLIAETPQLYLPQIIAAMTTHLDYVWILTERHSGGAARMWDRRIIVLGKPYLWFSKGKRSGGWVTDVIFGRFDKSIHEWGDGAYFVSHYIPRLTDETSVIFDPFTGGGTVPAVCKMLGRNYLAFEIDPATADIARRRVAETQMPLPGLMLNQTTMNFEV